MSESYTTDLVKRLLEKIDKSKEFDKEERALLWAIFAVAKDFVTVIEPPEEYSFSKEFEGAFTPGPVGEVGAAAAPRPMKLGIVKG
jgi:hypothetical protein